MTERSQSLVVAATLALLVAAAVGACRQSSAPAALVEQTVAYRTTSVPAAPVLPLVEDGPVRGVILFVGDGLGLASLTGARLVLVGPDGRLAIERLPVTGLLATHADGAIVPDSASAATALATGHKTANGHVAVGPSGERLRSLTEVAQAQGFATGLVTVSEIVDATPAAFASHALHREDEAEIAGQLLESGVEVLLGAGARWFLPSGVPPGVRKDGVDLIERARQRGYQVVRTSAELQAARGPKLLGLFDFDLDAKRPFDPPLVALTAKALDLVASRPRFFLMIEHEGTDTLAHHRDFAGVVGAVRELDEAVALAIDLAQRDRQILVIVTSDHETGGLLLRPGKESGTLQAIWGTRSHTGVPVPLFAYGPRAASFSGLRDNTEVPKILARLLEIPEL